MAFHMTPAAAREILAAALRSGAAGMALRVAAKPTGAGLAYAMGFDAPVPGDEISLVEGLTVLVAAGSREPLADTVLDYVELDSGERDFVFLQSGGIDAGCATAARGCSSGCRGCN